MAYEEFRDIFWKAEVEDLTAAFFDQFDRNLKLTSQLAETQFARVDQSAQASGKEIGFVAGVVGGLTAKLVEMGMQGVASIKGFIQQSVQLTARVGTLGVSLAVVGKNMGYTAEQLAQFEKDVKGMGITTRAARQSLLQMAQAQLDLGRSADIARVAQNAAVIAGVNSSEAFNRIVVAVQRLSPIMLRMLGITVNLQEEYKRFAAQSGTVVKALTYQQKQQITLNAVMRAGEGIAGAYEAAMGSVGKQMTSLPRYIEEVQLALGEAFQPALGAQIGFITGELKDLHKWLQENQEQIEKFAESLGKLTTGLFELLSTGVDYVAEVPGLVEEAGVILAKAVAQFMANVSPEDIEERRSKLGEYFGQAVTLLVTFITTAVKAITEVMAIAIDMLEVWMMKLHLVVGDADASLEKVYDRIEALDETILDFADDTLHAMGEFMGVVDDVGDAVEDAGEDAKEAATHWEALAAAVDSARGMLEKLKQELEMEAAEQAIQDYRDAIEDAIRMSHKLADLERRHLERLERAYATYVKAKKRLMADLSDREAALVKKRIEGEFDVALTRTRKLIDIETDYQRMLQDLKTAFERDMGELARTRDAIGMRRAARQHQRDLADAKKNRDRSRSDTDKDYGRKLADLTEQIRREQAKLAADRAKRLRDLEENYREQLAKAEDARRRDYDNLERSLARQKEIEDLHARWKAEDRQKALREELRELTEHFAGIEGMTAYQLRLMLQSWEQYFGDLEWLVDEYTTRIAQQMQTALPSFVYEPGFGLHGPGGPGLVGQAGQVSQLLAEPVQVRMPTSWNVPMMSPVPAVAARRGAADRREVHLSGDVAGLDPYMQRVLVTGLMEIERNAG